MPSSVPLTAQSTVVLSEAQATLQAKARAEAMKNLPGQTTSSGDTRLNLTPAQSAKMDAAAREFESVYLTEMMKPMLDTVPVDDVFGGGKGEDVFRGMLADEYGKIMARSGGIGLASSVREAMIRAQEAANGQKSSGGGQK